MVNCSVGRWSFWTALTEVDLMVEGKSLPVEAKRTLERSVFKESTFACKVQISQTIAEWKVRVGLLQRVECHEVGMSFVSLPCHYWYICEEELGYSDEARDDRLERNREESLVTLYWVALVSLNSRTISAHSLLLDLARPITPFADFNVADPFVRWRSWIRILQSIFMVNCEKSFSLLYIRYPQNNACISIREKHCYWFS